MRGALGQTEHDTFPTPSTITHTHDASFHLRLADTSWAWLVAGGCVQVFTLRPSYEYWPTLEVRWRPEDRRWELKQHGCSSTDHANGNKRLALAN